MSPVTKKPKTVDAALEEKCINAVRMLSAEMVQKANSGHPGAPMGCAPMAVSLFTRTMNYSPGNPKWFNRDRFVLSNGHACALLYSMLHLTGYERPTMDDLKKFRQLDSVTAGHPENHLLEAVEVATGPLGQGISQAVGMAVAQSHLAATFNKPGFDVSSNFTYVICGDGCLQEGVSSEASSLAGHLKLGKLIVLYDDNKITIDGSTDLSFTEDVAKRYEAYGWQVITITSGDSSDLSGIVSAIEKAKACTDKPTLIKVATTIGFGSKKQGSHETHGSPLGWEDIKAARTSFGFEPEGYFTVPDDVLATFRSQVEIGKELESEWDKLMASYAEKYPAESKELTRRIKGELPSDWMDSIPAWSEADKADASRNTSGLVLNAIASKLPEIMGGSADLTPSNKTLLTMSGDFQAATPEGRYLRFGVREHGMSAICNGMAAYGGFIPYCATFLNFVGYALGAVRLSALSEFQVLYVMTHDSIGLGEDGPTHQPIGILAALRAMPNFYVFRPADGNEVAGSYKAAVSMRKSPSLFALSRQNLPNLALSTSDKVLLGAYEVTLADSTPVVTIVATGSEVYLAVDAAKLLKAAGIDTSVVSMPCMELFEKQSVDYKKSIFRKDVLVVSVEAMATFGWSRHSHFQIGIDTFGKSAPYLELYDHFGLTPEKISEKIKTVHASYKGKSLTWLADAPQL